MKDVGISAVVSIIALIGILIYVEKCSDEFQPVKCKKELLKLQNEKLRLEIELLKRSDTTRCTDYNKKP
jgi:hypothetical protein